MKDSKEFASWFHDGTAEGIPSGRHELRIRATGFWSTNRTVEIEQSESWLVTALEIGMDAGEGGYLKCHLTGRVTNIADYSRIYVRLAGVFSELIEDAKVSPNGDFDFGNVPVAIYTLTATEPGQVLASSSLRLDLGNKVVMLEIHGRP